MATTITYKITNLKRKLDTGWVYSADFTITGEDGEHKHTMTTSLDLEKSQWLVPYEELEEARFTQVIQEATPHLEREVKEIIQEKVTPTIGEGVPWS